jgi:hypothetical protein
MWRLPKIQKNIWNIIQKVTDLTRDTVKTILQMDTLKNVRFSMISLKFYIVTYVSYHFLDKLLIAQIR